MPTVGSPVGSEEVGATVGSGVYLLIRPLSYPFLVSAGYSAIDNFTPLALNLHGSHHDTYKRLH